VPLQVDHTGGATGDLCRLAVNGSNKFVVTADGAVTATGSVTAAAVTMVDGTLTVQYPGSSVGPSTGDNQGRVIANLGPVGPNDSGGLAHNVCVLGTRFEPGLPACQSLSIGYNVKPGGVDVAGRGSMSFAVEGDYNPVTPGEPVGLRHEAHIVFVDAAGRDTRLFTSSCRLDGLGTGVALNAKTIDFGDDSNDLGSLFARFDGAGQTNYFYKQLQIAAPGSNEGLLVTAPAAPTLSINRADSTKQFMMRFAGGSDELLQVGPAGRKCDHDRGPRRGQRGGGLHLMDHGRRHELLRRVGHTAYDLTAAGVLSVTGGITANVTGNLTGSAPAGSLSGSTLAAGVTASSLTSVGTLTGLTTGATTINGGLTLQNNTQIQITSSRVHGVATFGDRRFVFDYWHDGRDTSYFPHCQHGTYADCGFVGRGHGRLYAMRSVAGRPELCLIRKCCPRSFRRGQPCSNAKYRRLDDRQQCGG
jgi:hypothetical protein